jgi:hypothetical protein
VKTEKIELPDNIVQALQKLPETGMGYQKVRVILRNGKVLHNHFVFNCSVLALVEDEHLKPEDIVAVELENDKAA